MIKNYIRMFALCLIGLLYPAQWALSATSALVANGLVASSGTSGTITLQLGSWGNETTMFQTDLYLPSGVTIDAFSIPSCKTDHQVSCVQKSDGSYRVMVSSQQLQAFGSQQVLCQIKISDPSSVNLTLAMKNTVLVSISGVKTKHADSKSYIVDEGNALVGAEMEGSANTYYLALQCKEGMKPVVGVQLDLYFDGAIKPVIKEGKLDASPLNGHQNLISAKQKDGSYRVMIGSMTNNKFSNSKVLSFSYEVDSYDDDNIASFQWKNVIFVLEDGTKVHVRDGEGAIRKFDLEEGTYFLKNSQTGHFLQPGAYWGTHAVAADYPVMDVKVTNTMDGTSFDTGLYLENDGSRSAHYLCAVDNVLSNVYCDQTLYYYQVDRAFGNLYMISVKKDGVRYYLTEANNGLVELNMFSGKSYWEFVKAEDLMKELSNGASFTSPKDVTFVIKGANCSRVDSRNSLWQNSQPTIGGVTGSDSEYGDYCAEFYDCTFDAYQIITGLPEGIYRIDVQGFYRKGLDEKSSESNVYLYGNDNQIPLMSIASDLSESSLDESDHYVDGLGYCPNSMSGAVRHFQAGAYNNSLKVRVGSDGVLKLGFKKDVAVSSDWMAFDNLRLSYLGTPIPEDINMDGVSDINDVQFLRDALLQNDNAPLCDKLAADIDGNGKITIKDCTELLRIMLMKK